MKLFSVLVVIFAVNVDVRVLRDVCVGAIFIAVKTRLYGSVGSNEMSKLFQILEVFETIKLNNTIGNVRILLYKTEISS
jgi:hypothetical protein